LRRQPGVWKYINIRVYKPTEPPVFAVQAGYGAA
jgi:hypothetical protein